MWDNNDAIPNCYYQPFKDATNSFDLGSKPLATISRRLCPLPIYRGCLSYIFVRNYGLSLGFLSMKRDNFKHAGISCFTPQRTALGTPRLNVVIVWAVIGAKQWFWALFSTKKWVTYNKIGSDFQWFSNIASCSICRINWSTLTSSLGTVWS